MSKSMTGFGRGCCENSNRSFIVEIKGVNHRYLDINVKMPRYLISLEDRIRKTVQSNINRGKVDIYITQNTYEKENAEVILNKSLAENYVKCLENVKQMFNVKDDVSVSLIAKFPEVIIVEHKEEDLEEIWDELKVALKDALIMMTNMREKEGLKLVQDITFKCNNIKDMVNKVKEKSPLVVEKYKQKLTDKVKEFSSNMDIDENRLAMEIVIFADKACIDEEIVRLDSHIIQMKETLKLEGAIGRKLDFIVQEMNRETNTIASKGNDLDIVHLVLNIKTEIEKVREQIQNIE